MKNRTKSIIAFSVIAFFMIAIEVWNAFDSTKNYSPKEKAKIHLYGESHGEPGFYKKELEAWGNFYSKGYRDLFVELPYYSAEFLNLWMKADDDEILNQFYADIEGALSHVEEYLDFLHTIKKDYPQTVFYGTDVGHQYYSTGKRYLEYLENAGLKDSENYKLTEICIEQGKIYYGNDNNTDETYREQKMIENFISAYDRLGQKEIMGIYGSYHINMKDENIMAAQLKAHYGDVIETVYVFNLFTKKPFTFGFGYVGFVFVLMILVSNILLVKYKPIDYEKYAKNDNKIFSLMAKIGQVLSAILILFFTDCNLNIVIGKNGVSFSVLEFYIVIVFDLMLFYEIYFIKYLKSAHTMKDFYSGFIGIPLAGAVIPVLVLFILGVYSRNVLLIVSSVVLGIGRIGSYYRNVCLSQRCDIINA